MLKSNKKLEPLVSILIANYNNQKLLKRSIRSCLKQKYKNFEILVFDDFSSDGSQNILKKFKKNKKIKIILNRKKKNIPYLDAMNAYVTMFKKSKGKFIFLLDSDDKFNSLKISKLMKIYLNDKSVKFIQDVPKILTKNRNFVFYKNFYFSRWPFFSPTSCLSAERIFFYDFIKYNKFSLIKYPNVWLDFRLCSYSYFKRKNFLFFNHSLTGYDQKQNSNQSKIYLKFKPNWIYRRYFSHMYINNFKKNKLILNLDYIFTKFIYKILCLLK